MNTKQKKEQREWSVCQVGGRNDDELFTGYLLRRVSRNPSVSCAPPPSPTTS